MQYLPEEEIFVKQIINAKEQLNKNQKVTLLKFLDQRKQEIIKNIFKNNQDKILFFGGFNSSEYKRCIISPFKITNDNLSVRVFKIKYNKRYLKLNHRNVLGNLMALGIKRESIGDIVIENNECYFACCKEIKNFLIDEFKTLNNMPISLEVINDEVIKKFQEYQEEYYLVSSLRLDVILSKTYNLSRNESKDFILEKRVKVNHVLCQNISHTLNEGDLLSVNKKGRIKFLKIVNVSSKGKIKVLMGKVK